jgi:hypothetical protein
MQKICTKKRFHIAPQKQPEGREGDLTKSQFFHRLKGSMEKPKNISAEY